MKNVTRAVSFTYGLIILLMIVFRTAEATDMTKWIDEEQGFKPTRVCSTSTFEIVLPPFSTENEIADGDTCGKIYVFVDSDSDKRVGFTGVMIFDRVIDPQKYAEARRQLVAMIVGAGGEAPTLKLSEISEKQTSGFSFETIGMQSDGIDTPDGKMTWEIGLRQFDHQTVMLFSGLTDLARNQEILNDAEKESANDLLVEFARWQSESLDRLNMSAPKP